MAERPVAPTAPGPVLETESGSTVMTPVRDHHFGRDPLDDIAIDDSRASLRGLRLRRLPAAAAARIRRDAEAGTRP